MSTVRLIASELVFHILTIAIVLVFAAGASHRLGSKSCGKHSSYSAHAASRK